mmetsp:Transcript_43330/g.68591  ORF Transcript_43330/g.68591 Transcript_43330/m.68591 type:complete len:89 (+) Transcript_43330:709-975(+)
MSHSWSSLLGLTALARRQFSNDLFMFLNLRICRWLADSPVKRICDITFNDYFTSLARQFRKLFLKEDYRIACQGLAAANVANARAFVL